MSIIAINNKEFNELSDFESSSYCRGIATLLEFIQMDAYWCMYLPCLLE